MNAQSLNFVAGDAKSISFTVGNGTTVYTKNLKADGTFLKRGFVYQALASEQVINLIGDRESVPASVNNNFGAVRAMPLKPMQSEFPINQRFEFLDKFTNMVLDGDVVSEIITGEGGLGKSHTVLNALAARNMVEFQDYVVIKGYVTAKALYATMFEHNGKVIVFDDCDKVLQDPVSLNILKGGLDSYAKRIISWLHQGFGDDDLPPYFEFTGKIIFISNKSAERLDGALKSRSIVIDLSMSLQDKIDRMQHILADILPEYSMEIKQATLDFMKIHAAEAIDFNLRTLIKSTKVVNAYGLENDAWEDAVKYLLVQA